MTTQTENDLLTRTGPGTACGDLMRSYWQPVALGNELEAGGAPVPATVMGEELVLFRDDSERVGLLDIHCSHRGTDLSYGRVEDGGEYTVASDGCAWGMIEVVHARPCRDVRQ